MTNLISHGELLRTIHYDTNKGLFFWKTAPNRKLKSGSLAGSPKQLRIKSVAYSKGHLAWYYVHKEYPEQRFMYYLDGNSRNYVFSNLSKDYPYKCDWQSLKSRNAYIKAWNDSHPGRARDAYLKSVYGISLMQYEQLHDAQDGKCAICLHPETATRNGKIKRLCVDHDHKTNVVRQLLCDRCNVILGLAQDDVVLFSKAIEYVTKHSEETSK